MSHTQRWNPHLPILRDAPPSTYTGVVTSRQVFGEYGPNHPYADARFSGNGDFGSGTFKYGAPQPYINSYRERDFLYMLQMPTTF